MKKAVASALLFVFVFNLVGYKVLYFCLSTIADARLEAKIADIRENDDRLITVRIPVNLPYAPDKTDYEPATGEVKSAGITYRYVMWRIDKGQLELLCIRNTEKSALTARTDEFVQKISLLISGNKKKIAYKDLHVDFFQFPMPVASATTPRGSQKKYPILDGLDVSKGYLTPPAIPPIS